MRIDAPWLAPLLLLPLWTACDSPGGDGGAIFYPRDDASADATSDTTAAGDTTALDDSLTTADSAQPPRDTSQGPGPSPLVDPACLDGQYSEPFPSDGADISALVSAFSPSSYRAFIDQVLAARYPTGGYLVSHSVAEYTATDCVALFTQGSTESAESLLDRMEVVVHECGHLLDGARGSYSDNAYVIREDLVLTCAGGDSRARGGQTQPRSAITQDEYDALLPGDFYKDTYLVGDGSEQGFNMLMEEAVQYINSLVTSWALRDQMNPMMSTSARDGILTFLWYMERYLHLMRATDKPVHDFILSDPCWRELILTVWGRAWQYLDETADISQLGIDDAELEALVKRPELVDEIDRVRQAHGCP